MNNEQQELLDEAYDKYTTKYIGYDDVPSKELFLFEIKTNPEFSEKWGLKIEERELSLEERMDLSREKRSYSWNWQNWSEEEMEWRMNHEWNIPTKLITLTYNNETVESYE
jgi:hypothetical protein